MTLHDLGLCPFFSDQVPEEAPLARILSEHRGALLAHTGRSTLTLAPHEVASVGDWVLWEESLHGPRVRVVLERRSFLQRTAAGAFDRKQVVAANLDHVFVVTSLNRDLSLNRLERFLVATASGGIPATLILNKADLGPHQAQLEAMRQLGAPVIATSALSGLGIEQLKACLSPGRTAGLIGMSGVGKSSLLNAVAGLELMDTGGIRESDARGKHTTTRRELFVVPDQGIWIDTPGMREVGLTQDADPSVVFADLEALARSCRYRDCHHDGDEGCALDAAIDAGTLTERRVQNWFKLQREAERASRRHEAATQRAHAQERKATLGAIDAREAWEERRARKRAHLRRS